MIFEKYIYAMDFNELWDIDVYQVLTTLLCYFSLAAQWRNYLRDISWKRIRTVVGIQV